MYTLGMTTEAIGETIRAFRGTLGLSQADVGRLLGLSREQARRIESQDKPRRSLKLGEAAVLARAFGCPLEVLADIDLARQWLADMYALVSNLVTDLAAEANDDGPQPTSGLVGSDQQIRKALFDMEARLTEHRHATNTDNFVRNIRVMAARRDFGFPTLLDEARVDAILRQVQTEVEGK